MRIPGQRQQDYRIEFAEAFMHEMGCGSCALELAEDGWHFVWSSPRTPNGRWACKQQLSLIRDLAGWDPAMQARALASEVRAKWGGEDGFDQKPAEDASVKPERRI